MSVLPDTSMKSDGKQSMSDRKPSDLLQQPIKVINVGLEGFANELAGQDVSVVQVQWSPPAGGNPKLADLLSKLGS